MATLRGDDHLDEVLVVDVSVVVLLSVDERLHLLLGHLLAQGGQHVAELGAGDEAAAVLKKNAFSISKKNWSFSDTDLKS